MRLLVTAGPTCEDIDEVRFLTNRSTGRMGYAVAAEAARRGHRVELVSGPVQITAAEGVTVTLVRSARQMLEACQRLFPACDAMVASAAVADYRPAAKFPGKLKKSDADLVLPLVRNPDITRALAENKRPGQLIVGFALEATDIYESRSSAEAKMADKKQDMAVLNGPAAMGAAGAEVSFCIPGEGWSEAAVLEKTQVAARILDFLERTLERTNESDTGDRTQTGD